MAVVTVAIILAQPSLADLSFDVAYSNLSSHGSWLVSAQYGRVWQPNVYSREWNPYCDGHWVYTEMGWTWVSDYEWGAIPYHYGTWVADQDFGWVWIPGSVWASSWVVFRTSSDYIGWAPVPPGFSVGKAVDMGEPSNFVFVPSRSFLSSKLRISIIRTAHTTVFVNNTTAVESIVIRHNLVVNRGPDYRLVESSAGRRVLAERIEKVARVSPFQTFSRAQLEIDPDWTSHGVRVTDLIPAKLPLPASSDRVKTEQHALHTGPPGPLTGRQADRPTTREPLSPSVAVVPGSIVDTTQTSRPNRPPPRAAAADLSNGTNRAESQPSGTAQPNVAPRSNATAGNNLQGMNGQGYPTGGNTEEREKATHQDREAE